MGLICMLDANAAITTLGQDVPSTFDYVSQQLRQISPNILQLSQTAYAVVARVNHRLNGLASVNSTSKAFLQSLATTESAVQYLQFLVEGCKSTVTTCTPQQNPANWNRCVNRQHSIGKGTVMSSGATNPACRNANDIPKACPCCINCTVTRFLLANAAVQVPSNFAPLDKKFSPAEIDIYLQESARSADGMIRPYQTFVNDARASADSLFSAAEDRRGLRTGAIFAIWAPLWLTVALALLGLLLAPCAEPPACAPRSLPAHPGNLGGCLHWTALVLGILWVSLVTLPASAVLSVAGAPLSDLCRLIPRPGDDPSFFIGVFLSGAADGADAGNLSDALRQCVLAPNGSLVGASLSASVDRALDPLRVSKNRITNQTVARYLAAQAQGADFVIARGRVPHMRNKATELEKLVGVLAV
jgi:hypothetical protein